MKFTSRIKNHIKNQLTSLPYLSIYTFHFIVLVWLLGIWIALLGIFAIYKTISIKQQVNQMNVQLKIKEAKVKDLDEVLDLLNNNTNQSNDNNNPNANKTE